MISYPRCSPHISDPVSGFFTHPESGTLAFEETLWVTTVGTSAFSCCPEGLGYFIRQRQFRIRKT
jgi:hypothetical protein